MSWRDNRRRKRTWYRHYKWLCDRLSELVVGSGDGKPIAAEAIIGIMFELYENRRMHGKRRIAKSAFESLKLACKDTGIDSVLFRAAIYPSNKDRPAARGEFEPEPKPKYELKRAAPEPENLPVPTAQVFDSPYAYGMGSMVFLGKVPAGAVLKTVKGPDGSLASYYEMP